MGTFTSAIPRATTRGRNTAKRNRRNSEDLRGSWIFFPSWKAGLGLKINEEAENKTKAKNKDAATDQRVTDPVEALYWDENRDGADLTVRSSAASTGASAQKPDDATKYANLCSVR